MSPQFLVKFDITQYRPFTNWHPQLLSMRIRQRSAQTKVEDFIILAKDLYCVIQDFNKEDGEISLVREKLYYYIIL